MKKIIIACALSVLALLPTFADMDVRVEVATDIVKFNTVNTDATDYFTSIDYDDFKVDFKLANDMFGAGAVLGVDARMQNIEFASINAWGKFGTFLKIQFGDFDSRLGGSLTGVIDEYELGILQYNTIDDGISRIFKTLAEGNKLDNFVVDFYVAPLSPIPVTLQFMMKPTNFKEKIHFGGRAYAKIFDLVNINVTAIYFDNDTKYYTTIGGFFEFPTLIANLKVIAGYTAHMWQEKNIINGNTQGLDHGIDLRAQIPIELPIGNVILATHNNLSLYGDAGNDKKYMAVSNEVKARLPIKGGMSVSLALKSHYYNNPSEVSTADIPKSFYDFSTVAGFGYTFGENATLETGIEVLSIGNDQADIIIAVPFNFTIWF